MINPLPIRIRLTLLYSLAMAATMFAIGFVALWMVHRAVDYLEMSELRQRARSVIRFVESRPENESFPQLQDDIATAFHSSHGNKWLQVIDEQGRWLYRSPHVAAVYPSLVLPQRAPREGRFFTYTAESLQVRALIEPISVHGVRYTVQTGLTLGVTLAVLSNFRIHLFLLITVGLLVSSIAGHFMSRKALQPVAALAAEASRINDRHLEIRLRVPDAKDEISDLSRTLNQMLERIDKAFASVRTFADNASHELRTPLTVLRGEIEVALHHPRKVEEYEAILCRLHEETLRMTGLVESLLTLARSSGGTESIALEPIRVDVLFRLVGDTWKSAMSQEMLDFHVDCPQPDLVLLGDAQGILRLLSILLENASKFTPPGGAVTLSAVADGERVAISVRDTGIGIAAECQTRIFDRFYRVAPAGDTVPSGSGLGLALGKWIAERHGSELCVESEPGGGSCFSFSLERTDATVSAVEAFSLTRAESLTGLRLPISRML